MSERERDRERIETERERDRERDRERERERERERDRERDLQTLLFVSHFYQSDPEKAFLSLPESGSPSPCQ